MKIITNFLSHKKQAISTKLHSSFIIARSRKLVFFLCCTFAINAVADDKTRQQQNATPLNLGLIPHLSTNLMMKKYGNLINYLEDQLQRPVIINTAPNYKAYVKRCAEGIFDLYMTAPHMAVYHEKHHQHTRLAKFSNELRSVIAVRENSPYKTINDLKGKIVSAADPLAVNTLNGEVTLKNNGLNIEKDININYTPSMNNALFLLANNKSEAAISGLPVYNILIKSGKLKQPLRILKKSSSIPHMMFMTPQRTSETDIAAFKNALLNIHENETGNAFLSNVPFGTLVNITDEDITDLDLMQKLLKLRLKE